jgi:hypothetical protein
MSRTKRTINFFDTPYLLTKREMNQPEVFFAEFFTRTSLSEVRTSLANIVIASVTAGSDEFAEPDQRANLIHFCKQIELAMEAGYTIGLKSRRKKNQ